MWNTISNRYFKKKSFRKWSYLVIALTPFDERGPLLIWLSIINSIRSPAGACDDCGQYNALVKHIYSREAYVNITRGNDKLSPRSACYRTAVAWFSTGKTCPYFVVCILKPLSTRPPVLSNTPGRAHFLLIKTRRWFSVFVLFYENYTLSTVEYMQANGHGDAGYSWFPSQGLSDGLD